MALQIVGVTHLEDSGFGVKTCTLNGTMRLEPSQNLACGWWAWGWMRLSVRTCRVRIEELEWNLGTQRGGRRD